MPVKFAAASAPAERGQAPGSGDLATMATVVMAADCFQRGSGKRKPCLRPYKWLTFSSYGRTAPVRWSNSVRSFEADLGSRELFKDGRRIPLANQSFVALAVLLERPGQLVSREELRRRIWPDNRVELARGIGRSRARPDVHAWRGPYRLCMRGVERTDTSRSSSNTRRSEEKCRATSTTSE
jgi:hypothetical protein